MKPISLILIMTCLMTTPDLFGQWDNNGDNPYNGSANPIIDRNNPYLILDASSIFSKSGLRFRNNGNLIGSIIYQGYEERISFGPDLLPNNAPVVVHLNANEMDDYYSTLSNDGLFKVGEEAEKKLLFDRDDIQAFGTNNVPSPLRLNYHGGNVNIGNGGIAYVAATDKTGIGTTSPKKRLDVNGDIALSNGTANINMYEGNDLKAFIKYNGLDLSIVNQEDTNPAGGDIILESEKDISLNTLGSAGAGISLETLGSFSGIDLTTNDSISDISLTTLHDNSSINLVSQGDITLENTSGDGNLNFITKDTLAFSTSSFEAPVILETAGLSSNISMITSGSSSDINLETSGSTSDINMTANGSSADILLDAGSDVDLEANNIIRFWNNDTLSMKINQSGQVGIGTSNPQFDLQVDGDLDITGEFSAASDIKLKKKITALTNASTIISALNPVSYYFRTDEFPGKNLSKRQKMGLIAQEVEKVLPNLVVKAGTTVNSAGEEVRIKSVNYLELIPLLIRANQEQIEKSESQEKTILALKAENDSLKNEIDNLNRRFKELESIIKKQL